MCSAKRIENEKTVFERNTQHETFFSKKCCSWIPTLYLVLMEEGVKGLLGHFQTQLTFYLHDRVQEGAKLSRATPPLSSCRNHGFLQMKSTMTFVVSHIHL